MIHSSKSIGTAAVCPSPDAARLPAVRPKGQSTLDFDAAAVVATPVPTDQLAIRNRVAGRCAVCGAWAEVGATKCAAVAYEVSR